jgi:hypothetical protein
MDRLSNTDALVARLLRKARWRLWRIESQRRLQAASFVALGGAAALAAIHGFWRALPPGAGAIVAVAPLLAAVVLSLARRPTRAQTAAWADRTLSGAAFFSTFEEHILTGAAGGQSRAVAALRNRAAAACEPAARALAGVRIDGVVRLIVVLGCTVLLAMATRVDTGRDAQEESLSVATAPLTDTATRQMEEARRELRAALQSTAADSAANRDLGGPPVPAITDSKDQGAPGGRAARPGAMRTGTTVSASSGTQTSGAGSTAAPARSDNAASAVDLRAAFRRLDSNTQRAGAGSDSEKREAFDALGRPLADADYDRRQALLARRVAPASKALAPSMAGVPQVAAQLLDRYQANKNQESKDDSR